MISDVAAFSAYDMAGGRWDRQPLPSERVRSIIRQTIHCDITPSNILAVLPDTEDVIAWVLKEVPSESHGSAVTSQPFLGSIADDGQPATMQQTDAALPLTLIDYGDSSIPTTFIGRQPEDLMQVVRFRAPDILLGDPWTTSIDIWSIGCMAFELLTGDPLFWPEGKQFECYREAAESHLQQMATVTGETFPSDVSAVTGRPPLKPQVEEQPSTVDAMPKRSSSAFDARLDLAAYASSRHPWVPYVQERSNRQPVTMAPLRDMLGETKVLDDAELPIAVAFLLRCLHLRADERPTAAELLDDPWMKLASMY